VLVAGTTAHYLGKTAIADKYLTSYLKQFPQEAYARKLLAANLLQSNQPTQALDALAPLLSHGGDVQTLAIAGHAARRSNEFAKSDQYLTKAVSIAPKNVALRTELGLTHLAAGNIQHGISDLESAIQMEGSTSEPELALISTYLQRADYDKALAAISVLEKKQPNSPATFNMRGFALLGLKKPDEARTSFEKALALQPDFFPAANNLAALEIKSKNLDAARGYLQTFLKKAPSNAQAMLAMAEVSALAGDDKQRLEWLEKASKAAPSAIEPRKLLTVYHINKKDFPKALSIAREVQSVHPDSAAALHLLAAVQSAAGDRDGALATYANLVRQDPKSPFARYRLALLQMDSQNWSAARESLMKALDLEPKYRDAQAALTTLEVRTGRSAEALKLAQQMVRSDPTSAVGSALEGDVRMVQNDYSGAIVSYDRALSLAQTPVLFIKAHNALMHAGKLKEADARADQWTKDQPVDTSVYIYLADVDMRSGRNKAAVKHYQAVLQKEPDNVVVLNNLASLYQKEGDSRALATAEHAYKLRAGDPVIMDTLGWILLEQGEVKRGVQLLREAVAKSSASPLQRYHLAVGYVKSGDKATAREILDTLLASSDAFPERAEVAAFRGQL
jgi:putative PEP-CTERM system TPR-repeat lipoprotein